MLRLLDKFEIILSRDDKLVYFPGEEVSGNLIVKAKDRLKINSMQLEFKGEAYTYWVIGSGDNDSRYTESKTLFEEKQLILQKQANSSHIYLEDFEQKFPFKYTLPANNLPTSFEHPEAYIRYSVKATIDVQLSFNEHALRCFTVINPLDLNLIPGLNEPGRINDIKHAGPFKSDPIIIDLQTNKSGFVPGESIVFNALIGNQSSNKIKSVSAVLIQNIELKAGKYSTSHKNNIVTMPYTGSKIEPGMQINWSNVRLTIPPVCPSLLDTCAEIKQLIKIHYTLAIVVDVSTFSKNKVVDLPIVIGTVPLNDSNKNSSTIATNEYCRSIIDRHGKIGNDRHDLDKKEREAIGDYKKRFKYESSHFEPRYPYYGN